ncbi:MAG: LytTR family DNA-binding domain-containing protein [Cyclobacteriaceae bacterium]
MQFLWHIFLVVFFLGLISFSIESYLEGIQISELSDLLATMEISRLVFVTIILLGIIYAILLISKRETYLEKGFLQQSLFAIPLISILYIYGEQDRFLISDNQIEDLIDFSFILFLVTTLWALTTHVFRFFKKKFSTLKKSVFLLLRGITLLVMILPIDLLFNYLFLNLVYDLPLYEDYLVLEVPFKIMIILVVNFLDEVVRKSTGTVKKPAPIKVRSGNQFRFIELNVIAYFLVKNQICYLYTISGEKFMTDLTLTQLEKELEGDNFFRASRQLLVARKAVEGYRSAEGKKIELSLAGKEDNPNTHYISRLSAPFFRKWINGELGTIQS